jgi:hypothetical protein
LTPRLAVTTPPERFEERRYVIRVLLEEFLGQRAAVESGDLDHTVIRRDDAGGAVVVPDGLFAVPAQDWLAPGSLPREPVAWIEPREFLGRRGLPFERTPALYAAAPTSDLPSAASSGPGDVVTVPMDLFGSAFFMLTRYEECVARDTDDHGRFPASAGVAAREGFLDVPVVNQYAEVLWAALRKAWPRLRRPSRAYSLWVSHDVDSPFFVYRPGRARLAAHGLKGVGGDLVRRRDRELAARRARAVGRTLLRGARGDPHFNLDRVMDADESFGLSATYFVMAGGDGPFGAEYSLGDPEIKALLRRMNVRGHSIGLHTSYESAGELGVLHQEARALRYALAEEGVSQGRLGSRAHFLRWRADSSFRHLDEVGVAFDSSVGFADRAGFRCGVCREFTTFDLQGGKPLRLKERPLIAMESSVIDPWYMAMGHGERAFETFTRLADQCRAYSGEFALLWHNTRLLDPAEIRLYRRVLEACS